MVKVIKIIWETYYWAQKDFAKYKNPWRIFSKQPVFKFCHLSLEQLKTNYR